MEQRLKERLTGAAVLMLAAVIFIPMLLDNAALEPPVDDENRAAPGPVYESRIIPVEEISPPINESTDDISRPLISARDEQLPAPVTVVPVGQDENILLQEPAVDDPVVSVNPVVPEEATTVQEKIVAKPQAVAKEPAGGNGLEGWVVQLGSFSSERNAESLVRDFQAQGYPAYIEEISNESGPIYRVRVGPEVNKADAEQALRSLAAKSGLKGILVQYP